MEPVAGGRRDEGSVFIVVLVMMVIGALIVVPLLTYTTAVFRAGKVQTDKARSVELARGGTWVALNNESALFDMCTGGTLPSSLPGVSTTCQVLENATQRPLAEVPYHVAAIQSDVTLPPELTSGDSYVNVNSTATVPDDWDKWLETPDWTSTTEAGKVWLPQLPVQATSSGGTRDTTMLPGTQDPLYASCRVFFPGTFSSPITISEPTYFTSGVYYFTEPITIESGADVVVGNGAAGGCTTDFEAIAAATTVPDPLNMSGVGGTFVFGGDARLVVDDSAAGDIRFVMNQRYVSEDEASVAASSGVSIVSVNGTHEPLLPSEVLGDSLLVDGVIAVPASTVGTDGNPLAASSDYEPSVLTPKPTEPDAPINVVATPFRAGNNPWGGAATITWDVPNENGSLITGYTVVGDRDGVWCEPPAPTLPDTAVQNSCTAYGMRHDRTYTFTVVATNDVGDSDDSDPSNAVKARTTSSPYSPWLDFPSEPQNAAVGVAYSDGIELTWDAPVTDGGSAVVRYEVTAIDPITSSWVQCWAWWNVNSCVLETANGLMPGVHYDINVTAVSDWGHGAPAWIDGDPSDNLLPPPNPEPDPTLVTLGTDPAPVQVPDVPVIRMPEPIVDLTTTSAADVDISIAGYIAVPQGHVAVGAAVPSATSVSLSGGLVAGQVLLDPAGVPGTLDVWFDNPIAQKRVRIRSTSSGDYSAVSDAVVQVNRSGSIAINSWVVQ
jgi:hypothetical protein